VRETRTKRSEPAAPGRRKPAETARRPQAPPAGPGQALLQLQRTAGNQAVSALIAGEVAVQRDDGDAQPAPAPDQQQTVRTVRIDTDQGTRDNLSIPEAVAFLADKTDWTSNRIELMAGDHAALKRVHDDQAVVGWFADVFGGFVTMPELSIWDRPRAAIGNVRGALAAGDPAAAGTALQEADQLYQDAREIYLKYKEANFEGADNTITVLKGVIVVDAAVGAALTGGATLGASSAVLGGEATATVGASGLLTQAGAAGVVGMEGAALKDTGGQVAAGKQFNWTELAEQTAGGFAAGFLGAMISGPLKEMLAESCSGYVTEELMSDAELADIARALGRETLERSFLQSQLKAFIIDKIADKAGEWLAGKPIEVVTDELKKAGAEGTPPPEESDAVGRVAELAAPAVAAAFKSALNVE
jgi:hypothetical protein